MIIPILPCLLNFFLAHHDKSVFPCFHAVVISSLSLRRAALIAYYDPAPEEVFPEEVFPEEVFPEEVFPEEVFPDEEFPRAQRLARAHLSVAFGHVLRMHSFWLLTLSSGARQLSGNVFGYYMPRYLSSRYPSEPNFLSNYGIIVGVVGSVAVLSGGLISFSWAINTTSVLLLLTPIGGMISSIFVILMILSSEVAGGNQSKETHVLYGTMSAVYITAELGLGTFAYLLVLSFPPILKFRGLFEDIMKLKGVNSVIYRC